MPFAANNGAQQRRPSIIGVFTPPLTEKPNTNDEFENNNNSVNCDYDSRRAENRAPIARNNDQQAEPLLDDHCSSVIVANVTDASTTALTAMTPHFPPSPPLSSSTPTEPTTGCTGNGVDYLSPYINNNGGDFGGGGGKPLSPPTDAFSAVAVGDKYLDEKDDEFPAHEETFRDLLRRHTQNLIHFFVEDWFISAMLGFTTAVLSISVDVGYEYLNRYRAVLFDMARQYGSLCGFFTWVTYMVGFVTAAALVCRYISVQAIGSGIPEVKVIMNGFMLKNYLSFRTLVAKVLSLTLTLGSGLPLGKEGPFVHMGAIVATLLSKMTKAWQSNAFFSNEGREMEILSSGCSVGIACTFSSPAGAVLYGIESTHKYFAVKNYWRAFFATTCSALIFRFANAVIIPPHIAGTITAYYQTSFPNEVFLVEEIPVFLFVGCMSGLLGALFVLLHRRITYFRKRNRTIRWIFGRNNFAFTIFVTFCVGVITYPDGFGRFIAGKFTFRETLSDFINNCTMSLHNVTSMGCGEKVIRRWATHDYGVPRPPDPLLLSAVDADADDSVLRRGVAAAGAAFPRSLNSTVPSVLPSLIGYLFVNYFMVAICITLALPAGIFVPSFVIGACGGRIVGEIMVLLFPLGIRGPTGPQIYPGLYAVVGAAAYTGAITHSLSIAVIVCETTGQLSALLPVLLALMVANAISSFLQPSIYESIINIKKYPHLAELPPSRVSVHTLKVEQIMVRDLVYITRRTTYRELRDLLIATPHLRSYPLVTDDGDKILLGSVARKYLHFLMTTHLGPVPSGNSLHAHASRLTRHKGNASELFGQFRRNSQLNLNSHLVLNDRNVCGNTLLSISPLHEDNRDHNPLVPLLLRQQANSETLKSSLCTDADRLRMQDKVIDLDEVAIDAAPFQLVHGTSLYKVHTLFSLLGLNHAYVTYRGHLTGVVSLRELRLALANIYTRGAVPPSSYSVSMTHPNINNNNNSANSNNNNGSNEDGSEQSDRIHFNDSSNSGDSSAVDYRRPAIRGGDDAGTLAAEQPAGLRLSPLSDSTSAGFVGISMDDVAASESQVGPKHREVAERNEEEEGEKDNGGGERINLLAKVSRASRKMSGIFRSRNNTANTADVDETTDGDDPFTEADGSGAKRRRRRRSNSTASASSDDADGMVVVDKSAISPFSADTPTTTTTTESVDDGEQQHRRDRSTTTASKVLRKISDVTGFASGKP